MAINLKGRSFLTLKDFTPDEISYLLKLAENLILGIIALYAINLPLRFVRLPTN